MPSPLPEVLNGLERFTPGLHDITPEESEPLLRRSQDGAYVKLSDVTDALRGEEGEAGNTLEQHARDLRERADRIVYSLGYETPESQALEDAAEMLESRVEAEADRSSPGLSGGDYAEEN